ncbi:MAG: hypothetical protein NC206_06330 [Bacteroides sp.]|nr:hypothetical protein [Roseburia sp.]MCM1346685.1 hypothetical protein [Bacteroides sp.]MCM1421253.1 hypothetical protein [Bacteroides sp.]
MKTEDIDKIIAEALEQEKQGGKRGHKRRNKPANIRQARKVLNILFMAGFIAAVIIYFACPEQKALFFSVGFGAMLLKIVEFCLRFMF